MFWTTLTFLLKKKTLLLTVFKKNQKNQKIQCRGSWRKGQKALKMPPLKPLNPFLKKTFILVSKTVLVAGSPPSWAQTTSSFKTIAVLSTPSDAEEDVSKEKSTAIAPEVKSTPKDRDRYCQRFVFWNFFEAWENGDCCNSAPNMMSEAIMMYRIFSINWIKYTEMTTWASKLNKMLSPATHICHKPRQRQERGERVLPSLYGLERSYPRGKEGLKFPAPAPSGTPSEKRELSAETTPCSELYMMNCDPFCPSIP